MKMRLALGIGLLVIASLAGCASRQSLPANAFLFHGKVVHVDIEDGFYGIVSSEGGHYDPVNLPKEYQQDGIEVRGVARPTDNAIGFHMWGMLVEIISIQRL
ncbi:hypothetical protein [Desulfocurvibacter africanus]|uniref:Lipoprotein n=1 Tax=Desulfocurvibacter africanus subsp. africanus str. Walvis Bay TaxID=690850 RepID=F3Z0P4_DESAF|nr:hypothetical protein [Desulfocurvibacter africanus]EGJ49868.1 hypothetical protein Desaf_1531 [Desulfocurvibacter africanus subsp. africanus str. Walvis Bay]